MPTAITSVCVYCASSTGRRSRYADVAKELGGLIVERGYDLVYGGGDVGLMGILADSVLSAGGRVCGVITRSLVDKEVAHRGLTELLIVDTMHERKARMAERADWFVMLPGGFGTLEEFFEAVTWTQLGIHTKPCGVLNIDGYFDPLRDLFERAADDGLLRPEHRDMLLFEANPNDLFERLGAWEPTTHHKWLDRA